eukprot:151529-Rhodomonas_salina.5
MAGLTTMAVGAGRTLSTEALNQFVEAWTDLYSHNEKPVCLRDARYSHSKWPVWSAYATAMGCPSVSYVVLACGTGMSCTDEKALGTASTTSCVHYSKRSTDASCGTTRTQTVGRSYQWTSYQSC